MKKEWGGEGEEGMGRRARKEWGGEGKDGEGQDGMGRSEEGMERRG